MTCRLNFLCSHKRKEDFFLWEHSLEREVPSRLFALCNLLGPLSWKRFVWLFPIIYNCSLPEFFGHKGSNAVDFNPSSRKYYCLTFTGIYFRPINPLKAELNLIRHLLALAGAHHFVHVSRARVKVVIGSSSSSLVFSPKAGFGRNQSPGRRPVWLWHTAF